MIHHARKAMTGLLLVAAGCATHKDKDKIAFSDDAEIRAAAASAVVQPAQKKLAVTVEEPQAKAHALAPVPMTATRRPRRSTS